MKHLFFLLVFVSVLSVFPAGVSAHVLDEYLQSAQIALTPDAVRLEMHLMPGVDVADRVFAAIDRDRNGQLSAAEQRAYAQRVSADLVFKVDNRPLPLILLSSDFPSHKAMKQGDAPINLTFSVATAFSPGDHQLTFRNNHWRSIAVYQVNALLPPTNSIFITSQQRDASQREFQLYFRIASPTNTLLSAPTSSAAAVAFASKATGAWLSWAGVLLFGIYKTLLPA